MVNTNLKSYNNLFAKVIDEENLRLAFINASKRKRKRRDVRKILTNLDYHVNALRQMLIEHRFIPGSDTPHVINEGTRHKNRVIRKPKFRYDQVVHHAVIQVMKPIFMKPMYEYSCGSIPGRGIHFGKKKVEKWIKDTTNTKYCFKMDIRHFYDSVDFDILKSHLGRIVRDKEMMRLLTSIVDGCERGLPLGWYTSQWFANFLLTPLDHYIKETLGATYYIRYMDDIVIFGPNKKKLHRMHKAIEKYLQEELNLRIKDNWQVFKLDSGENGRSLDFMGFQFFRDRTILRKSIFIRMNGRIRQLQRKYCIQNVLAVISYLGYLKWSNTRQYYIREICPVVNINKLKKYVSRRTHNVFDLSNMRGYASAKAA